MPGLGCWGWFGGGCCHVTVPAAGHSWGTVGSLFHKNPPLLMLLQAAEWEEGTPLLLAMNLALLQLAPTNQQSCCMLGPSLGRGESSLVSTGFEHSPRQGTCSGGGILHLWSCLPWVQPSAPQAGNSPSEPGADARCCGAPQHPAGTLAWRAEESRAVVPPGRFGAPEPAPEGPSCRCSWAMGFGELHQESGSLRAGTGVCKCLETSLDGVLATQRWRQKTRLGTGSAVAEPGQAEPAEPPVCPRAQGWTFIASRTQQRTSLEATA